QSIREPDGGGSRHRALLSHHGEHADDDRLGPRHRTAPASALLWRHRPDRERHRDRVAPERRAETPRVLTMLPDVFHFGILHVRSYGLMLAVAFLVGTWLSLREAKRLHIDEDRLVGVILVTLIASILGA